MTIKLNLSQSIITNGPIRNLESIANQISEFPKFHEAVDRFNKSLDDNKLPTNFSYKETAILAYYQTAYDKGNEVYFLTAHHLWEVYLQSPLRNENVGYCPLNAISSVELNNEGIFSTRTFLKISLNITMKLYYESPEDEKFIKETFKPKLKKQIAREKEDLAPALGSQSSKQKEENKAYNPAELAKENEQLIQDLNMPSNDLANTIIALNKLKYPKNGPKPISTGDIPLGFQFISNGYAIDGGTIVVSFGGSYQNALKKVISKIYNFMDEENADGAFNLNITHEPDPDSHQMWVYAYFDLAKKVF